MARWRLKSGGRSGACLTNGSMHMTKWKASRRSTRSRLGKATMMRFCSFSTSSSAQPKSEVMKTCECNRWLRSLVPRRALSLITMRSRVLRVAEGAR